MLLFSVGTYAQLGKVGYGDRLYKKFDFVKAIEVYEGAHKKRPSDQHVNQQLANCYMLIRQPKKAIPYYKNVVRKKGIDPQNYYNYAQALRSIGEYKKSEKWMRKYKASGAVDSRMDQFFDNPDFIDMIYNRKKRYDVENSPLNTEYSDYGAVDFKGQLYFVSARTYGKDKKKIYGWNNQPFLDIYKLIDSTGNIEKLAGEVNTTWHEGAVTFTPDGKYAYFTRNNFHNNKITKDSAGTNNLKIFKAQLIDGLWQNPKPLFFSSDKYSIGHPTISADGKKFFFTSDMPGGYGGTDIYMCDVHDRGGLKKPINLGPTINTEGNEMFPFYHDLEQKLYFSSDGHLGLGQLDIFVADHTPHKGKEDPKKIVVTTKPGTFENVSNLGTPINSIADDFAFNIDKLGAEGYLASNREGGQGDDDIYKFFRERDFTVKGIVTDEITGEPLENAKVLLSDSKGEIIFQAHTGPDGYYEKLIERNENFQINADKQKFENKIKSFNSFNQEAFTEMIVNISLDPLKDMDVLAGLDVDIIYFDFDRAIIREDAKPELNKIIAVMQKYKEMVVRLESHTDSRGSFEYNIKLSNRRAAATYNYLIENGIDPSRISSYKGYGERRLANDCADNNNCDEKKHQANRRTEFVIEKFR